MDSLYLVYLYLRTIPSSKYHDDWDRARARREQVWLRGKIVGTTQGRYRHVQEANRDIGEL